MYLLDSFFIFTQALKLLVNKYDDVCIQHYIQNNLPQCYGFATNTIKQQRSIAHLLLKKSFPHITMFNLNPHMFQDYSRVHTEIAVKLNLRTHLILTSARSQICSYTLSSIELCRPNSFDKTYLFTPHRLVIF